MEAYQISPAQKADIPQLMPLVNGAYRGEEAKKGWTHEADLIEGSLRTDESSLEELIAKPGSVILKYNVGSDVLGCVYLEKKGEALYLGMLSVSPEAQAQGIGRKLLQAAETHAKKQNCKLIEMTVISVRKELIAWYQRNGYQVRPGTQPFPTDEKFGVPRQPIEFIVMEKSVNGEA